MPIEASAGALMLNVAMKLLGCAAALIVGLMTAGLAEDQKPIKVDFGRLRGLNYRTVESQPM